MVHLQRLNASVLSIDIEGNWQHAHRIPASNHIFSLSGHAEPFSRFLGSRAQDPM